MDIDEQQDDYTHWRLMREATVGVVMVCLIAAFIAAGVLHAMGVL